MRLDDNRPLQVLSPKRANKNGTSKGGGRLLQYQEKRSPSQESLPVWRRTQHHPHREFPSLSLHFRCSVPGFQGHDTEAKSQIPASAALRAARSRPTCCSDRREED